MKSKFKEEIKMKTQAFKNWEIASASNFTLFVATIVLGGLLIINSNNKPTFFAGDLFKSQVKPEKELFLKSQPLVKPDEIVNQAAITKEPDINLSMAKILEYMTPVQEEELNVDAAKSIVFPDFEITEPEVIGNNFLLNLKKEAGVKTAEEVEFYALQRKVMAFSAIETEKSLEVEDWMISNKYWSPEQTDKIENSTEK